MRAEFVPISALRSPPDVAVVIDVMRAYTVAAWALGGGAGSVVLAASIDEAMALKREHPDWIAVTDGALHPGFDAGNSPGQMRTLDLAGRTVLQKTTAGTVGAHRALGARLLLCASFAVAAATAHRLRRSGAELVTFVVTGDDGAADEDRACAEYIAKLVGSPGLDAAEYLTRASRSGSAARLADGVRRGYPGIHADDLDLCLMVDSFDFAMIGDVHDGRLTLRAERP